MAVPPRADPPALPALPRLSLRVTRDRTSEVGAFDGFLNVRRLELVAVDGGGQESRPFHYDVAERKSLDAVVIAAHYAAGGVRHVYLRSALRPPLATRAVPPRHDGGLWELPAGLIDGGETPAEAAVRELGEELGFTVSPASMLELGPRAFPAPGYIGEIHYFFQVEVDPTRRTTPSEDGSVLEQGAVIVDLPLSDALEHCRRGRVPDSKTELALRRLVEAFS